MTTEKMDDGKSATTSDEEDEQHQVGQVTNCFSKFKIHNLDAEWMNRGWEDGNLSNLPDDFEAVHRRTNWASLLRDAADIVRQRRRRDDHRSQSPVDDNEIGEEFWTKLADNGISFKGVTVVTCSLVQRGLDGASNLRYADREVAVLAASLYLCLVSVPGSNAFRLFNPVLYQKALLMFRMANDVLKSACGDDRIKPLSGRGSRSKRRGAAVCSSQSSSSDSLASTVSHNKRRRRANGEKVGRKSKKAKCRHGDDDDLLDAMDVDEGLNNVEESDEESSQLDDDEAAEKEVVILTRNEVQSLIDLLGSLSFDLNLFLNIYSLKSCEQSLDFTVQYIGELLLVESRYQAWNLSRLTSRALEVLKSICNPLHGVVGELVWIVLKNLLQAILSDTSKKVACFVVQLAKEVPNGVALPGVRRFLQNICFKASEKADSRNKQCTLTFFILDQLPVAAYADVIEWLVEFACSAKVAHRLFTLELFSLILGHSSKEVGTDEIHPDKMQFVTQACLMKTVLVRCSDKASSLVRAKALSVVASATLSAEPNLHQLVGKMFVPAAMLTERVSDDGAKVVTSPAASKEDENALELLRHRTNDSKVHVRRAALQVLQSVIELHADSVTVVNVEAIQVHCRDSSLLVRKQAMQSVSDLLQRYPTGTLLQQAWLEGLLPMILDPEATVQAKCVDSVNDIILQNIVPAALSTESRHRTTWNILKKIESSRSKGFRHYLRRAVDAVSGQGKLKNAIVDALKTHVDTENNAVAWMMLSIVAPCVTIKNTDFIMSHWEKHQIDGADGVLQHMLIVIGEVSHTFDVSKRGSIMGQLAALMSEFKHQPMVISEMITTMNLLGLSKDGDNSDGEKIFNNCCKTIMKHCDNYLSSVFLNKKGKTVEIDEDRVVCYLFTVGELGLHCPAHVPKRIFLLMKSFLAAPSLQSNGEPLEIPNSQGSEGGTGIKNFDRFYCSMANKRIRRVAFISLGKLCLQHETLAKQCVPALGKELECSDDPIIRNNVVIIMADLCKRYATLVDEYIPSITACLRDTSVVVRRQTLLLLTNLLQEDYLKWKGSLFFQYMSALVDESSKMKSLAQYGLQQILDKRHPAMFQQHFVECLFHFNAYKDHEKYNKVILSEKDYQLFSLAGDNLREKRMNLYKFMLENMDDEHRFIVMTNTCQDILGGVLDHSISLTLPNGSPCVSGVGLLRDSFSVLCCDEIKLVTLRSVAPEDADQEDLEALALATAKKTVITQVVKKNAIDNIVPIVISLKHKLEKLRSPLLKELMRYLKELMKDYKNEIKEILSADKLLATEIEYDLKVFEQDNRMEMEQRKKEVLKRRLLSAETVVVTGSMAEQPDVVTGNDELVVNDDEKLQRKKVNKKNVANLTVDKKAEVEQRKTTSSTDESVRNEEESMSRTTGAVPKKTPLVQSKPSTLVVRLKRIDGSASTTSEHLPVPSSKEVPLEAVPNRPLDDGTSNATPIRPAVPFCSNRRAISTPRGTVTDITFQEQIDGFPVEPLSPIFELESSDE